MKPPGIIRNVITNYILYQEKKRLQQVGEGGKETCSLEHQAKNMVMACFIMKPGAQAGRTTKQLYFM